jgi:S-adenosylmethionine decarboxylase proenzyme
MHGLHLTADLYRCACAVDLLTRPLAIGGLCRQHAQDAGLTVVGEQWVAFPTQPNGLSGVTGMLLLAESHLAVHTWPELANVTLDVYVCNFTADNSAKAERLMRSLVAALEPARVQVQRLQRGEVRRD